MPTLSFRSPVTKPLLRKGTPKPVPPDPRAYDTFRVTQQYGDPDAYYKDRPHAATDIGNFRCGDPVVAMAPGIAYRVSDSAGALGVRIDHGHGITSEYWHLNRQDVYNGQPVNVGFQIGIVGRTGLGDVCHLHAEVKRDGSRIDPEPLMFGGFVVTGPEEDVKLAGKFLRHIQNRRTALTANSHFRSGVLEGADSSLQVFSAGTALFPVVAVEGRSVGGNGEWYGAWLYVDGTGYAFGYVHSSVVGPLEPIESPGGHSDADLAAARAEGVTAGTKAGFVDAKTKAAVAVQGIRP